MKRFWTFISASKALVPRGWHRSTLGFSRPLKITVNGRPWMLDLEVFLGNGRFQIAAKPRPAFSMGPGAKEREDAVLVAELREAGFKKTTGNSFIRHIERISDIEAVSTNVLQARPAPPSTKRTWSERHHLRMYPRLLGWYRDNRSRAWNPEFAHLAWQSQIKLTSGEKAHLFLVAYWLRRPLETGLGLSIWFSPADKVRRESIRREILSPLKKFGMKGRLQEYRRKGKDRRSFIDFDLRSVPVQTLVRAALELQAWRPHPSGFEYH